MLADVLYNPQILEAIRELTAVEYGNRIIQSLIYIGIALSALAFATLFIIGGIQYITSSGDKGKLESARNKIVNAITGFIVLLLLWFVLRMISLIFGVKIGDLGVPGASPYPSIPPPEGFCMWTPNGCECVCEPGYIPDDGCSVNGSVCTGTCYCLNPISPSPTPEPTVVVVNPATGLSCEEICNPAVPTPEWVPTWCGSIGVDMNAVEGTAYEDACLSENYIWRDQCSQVMDDIGISCNGIPAEWTNCRCTNGSINQSVWGLDGGQALGYSRDPSIMSPMDVPERDHYAGFPDYENADCYYNDNDWCGSFPAVVNGSTTFERVEVQSDVLLPDAGTCGRILFSLWGYRNGQYEGYGKYVPINCGQNTSIPVGAPIDNDSGCSGWLWADNDRWCGPLYSFGPLVKGDCGGGVGFCACTCPSDYHDVSNNCETIIGSCNGSCECAPDDGGSGAILETPAAQSQVLLPNMNIPFELSGAWQISCGAVATSVWGYNSDPSGYEGYITYAPIRCNDGQPLFDKSVCAEDQKWCGPYTVFGQGTGLTIPVAQSEVFLPEASLDFTGSGCGMVAQSIWGKFADGTTGGFSTYAPVDCSSGIPNYSSSECYYHPGDKWCNVGQYGLPGPSGAFSDITAQSEVELPLLSY